jgi:hypothetical protein
MSDGYNPEADAIGSWECAIAELRRRLLEERGMDDTGNWRSIGELAADVIKGAAEKFTKGGAA